MYIKQAKWNAQIILYKMPFSTCEADILLELDQLDFTQNRALVEVRPGKEDNTEFLCLGNFFRNPDLRLKPSPAKALFS